MKKRMTHEIDVAVKNLILSGRNIKNITMVDIAFDVGITAPTLYHYYKAKEDIFVNAYKLITSELIDIISIPLPSKMNSELQLKTRVVGLIEYVRDCPWIMHLVLGSGAVLHGPAQTLEQHMPSFRNKLKKSVQAYLKNKKKQSSAVLATYSLLAAVTGYMYYLKEKPADKHAGEIVEDVFSSWENGVR